MSFVLAEGETISCCSYFHAVLPTQNLGMHPLAEILTRHCTKCSHSFSLFSVSQGFGQWSTAQFDSTDQQQKFLRLMGGFKKGFQPASGTPGKANMALGKDAQQQLKQGLLGQFEQAHSRRIDFGSRGAGLGFTAPSNKKFSIDINASRSVRFDD